MATNHSAGAASDHHLTQCRPSRSEVAGPKERYEGARLTLQGVLEQSANGLYA